MRDRGHGDDNQTFIDQLLNEENQTVLRLTQRLLGLTARVEQLTAENAALNQWPAHQEPAAPERPDEASRLRVEELTVQVQGLNVRIEELTNWVAILTEEKATLRWQKGGRVRQSSG